MADVFTYSESMASSSSAKHIFLEKELSYITDSNSKNYSRNQVDFETVTLSNGGRWVDYKEAFISIPLVIKLTSTKDITKEDALESVKIKNNLSLIDSCSISYNNTNVSQEVSEISSSRIFLQHVESGMDDMSKSDSYGYVKDSPSWDYELSGLTNNKLSTASAQRQISPWETTTPSSLQLKTETNISESGADYYQAGADLKTHYFMYDCRIKLKDLSPFFAQMPLVKGANIKITLRLNQGSVQTVSVKSAVGPPIVAQNVTVTTSLKGSEFPVLRMMDSIANEDYTETLSVTVGKDSSGVSHNRGECRMYTPVYVLSPQYEASLLAQGSKTIVYEDVYINKLRAAHSSFSHLITNGLSKTTRMLVVPNLARDATNVSPPESPYYSAPCSPHQTRCNLKISGKNLYPSLVQYSFEHYLNEITSLGLNGGMQRGEASGMLSLKDFQSNHGYMYFDLARRHAEDDETPLSLEIFGAIDSPKPLDLLCCVFYEKEVTIDIATGQLIG